MLKETIRKIKKEAKELNIHPLKYFLEQQGVETDPNYYKNNPCKNNANYFMEDLYGLFCSTEEPTEYRIFKTDGSGYEREWGWELLHLFYSKEEAIEYRNKNYKRKLLVIKADGSEIWNY